MATVFRLERASAISKVTLLSLSHFPENCCSCRCAGLGAGHPGERPGPSGEARLACGKSSLPVRMTRRSPRVRLEKPQLESEREERRQAAPGLGDNLSRGLHAS